MHKMEYKNFSWPKHYCKEYFEFLLTKEKEMRKIVLQSPQLKFREELIAWLMEVCLKTNLSFLTLHLGVAIMDCFMDKHDILPYRLRSIAAGCLMLAAKFEQSGKMPTYAQVTSIGKFENEDIQNTKIILAIESKVLKFLDYTVTVPNTAQFLYYLLPLAVRDSDLKPGEKDTSAEEKIRMEMRDLLQETLTLILYDSRALQICPSMLAAASVVHARAKLTLLPTWPEDLIELSGYEPVMLSPALDLIFKYSRGESSPVADSPSNESGYLSQDCSSPTSQII